MKSWCRAPLVYRSFASSRLLFARTYSYQARIILKVLSFKGLVPDNLDRSSKLLYSKDLGWFSQPQNIMLSVDLTLLKNHKSFLNTWFIYGYSINTSGLKTHLSVQAVEWSLKETILFERCFINLVKVETWRLSRVINIINPFFVWKRRYIIFKLKLLLQN